jgi:hypothetical protein
VLIGGSTEGSISSFNGAFNGAADGTTSDCFYAVYNGTHGELSMGVQFGTAGGDSTYAISMSTMSDKIAVAGTTNGDFSSTFGYKDLTTVSVSNDNLNAFIGIYEPATNSAESTLLWGKVIDDVNDRNDIFYSVYFGPNDMVAVGGFVSGPVSTRTGDDYKDGKDAFVAVFNAIGYLMWAHSFGSAGSENSGSSRDDTVQAVVFDEEGNLYAAGSTDGELDLPPPYSQTKENTEKAADGFIVKYNSSGALQWGVQFGTDSSDTVYGIDYRFDESTNQGVIAVTGATRGDLYETNAGGDDIFVALFSASDGNHLAGKGVQVGSAGVDVGESVKFDVNGNVYVGGTVSGPVEGTEYQGGDSDAAVLIPKATLGIRCRHRPSR